jgi:hypothetical protein
VLEAGNRRGKVNDKDATGLIRALIRPLVFYSSEIILTQPDPARIPSLREFCVNFFISQLA